MGEASGTGSRQGQRKREREAEKESESTEKSYQISIMREAMHTSATFKRYMQAILLGVSERASGRTGDRSNERAGDDDGNYGHSINVNRISNMQIDIEGKRIINRFVWSMCDCEAKERFTWGYQNAG